MNHIEAMKQALEALEKISMGGSPEWANDVIPALRQAIEQADQQEPVARFNWNEAKFEWLTEYSYDKHHMKPLYLAPSRKEWVGLTDDDIQSLEHKHLMQGVEFENQNGYWAVYRAIEAKIKEKNT